MKNIYNRTRKIITYTIFLLLTLGFTKMCTYPPLSHNPQEEYCEIQADKIYKEQRARYPDFYNDKIRKAFVEIDGKFLPYNHPLHSEYESVFFERDGCNIHLSNSNSNGNPCALTKNFYRFYTSAFIVFFLFLHLAIYPLIKPRNQKSQENEVIKLNRPKKKILSRNVITYVIFLLLTLLFTKMCMYPDFSRNSQGEYCELQASAYNKQDRSKDLYSFLRKKAFVEVDGKFVPYDHSLHSNYELAFVECDGCNIHLSNSKSIDGYPCIVTRNFYNRYVLSFIIFFSFFHFIIYPLIKSNQTKKTSKP